MTEHPDDLLAEYVDGALPPQARAGVEAHVATCPRCRDQVAVAAQARAALGSLPEVPAPDGLGLAVRRAARPVSSRPSRWVAAGTAAALLLAGGLVVLRGLATDGGRDAAGLDRDAGEEAGREGATPDQPQPAPEAPAAEGAALSELPAVPTYTVSDRNYEPADLVALARRIRDRARARLGEGLARTATAFFQGFDAGAFTAPVRRAIECSLRQIPPDQLLVPFSIEAASFQREPAYVTAFLQGPTPESPYDRVVIWVAARDTCSLRSLASQRL